MATNKKAKPTAAAKAKPTNSALSARVGSQAHAINLALSAKPQTAAELAAKTKLSKARVQAHLASLLAKGQVVNRVAVVDKRVLAAIEERRMLEVSTGRGMADNIDSGVHNGKQYAAIARGIIPDHLAILPDKIGACSIADGAGLLRNEHVEIIEPLHLPCLSF
jgi:hypothetical protein